MNDVAHKFNLVMYMVIFKVRYQEYTITKKAVTSHAVSTSIKYININIYTFVSMYIFWK